MGVERYDSGARGFKELTISTTLFLSTHSKNILKNVLYHEKLLNDKAYKLVNRSF